MSNELSDRIGPAVGPGAGRRCGRAALLPSLMAPRRQLAQTPASRRPNACAEAGAPAQARRAATARRSSAGRRPAREQPQLMYSPWMKVCGKGQDTNDKQVCVISKDGRLENGMPVAIVAADRAGRRGQKVLRVTVPLGMQLAARHPRDHRPGPAGHTRRT